MKNRLKIVYYISYTLNTTLQVQSLSLPLLYTLGSRKSSNRPPVVRKRYLLLLKKKRKVCPYTFRTTLYSNKYIFKYISGEKKLAYEFYIRFRSIYYPANTYSEYVSNEFCKIQSIFHNGYDITV